MEDRIYLDFAATTPLDKEVHAIMSDVLLNVNGNPSSIHAEGRKARSIIEKSRKEIAFLLKASIGEIFFTSCGTESNNTILKHAVKSLGVTRIITSPVEHPSVSKPIEFLLKNKEITVEYVDVNSIGKVDEIHLETLLKGSKAKTLVSIMHVNNETSVVNDLSKLSKIIRKYDGLFHSDTVQSIGYFDLDLSLKEIDFLAASGHKFYGPKGTGFMYINNDLLIEPFIHGGAQERNMRSGTENIAGIVGIAEAFKRVVEHRTKWMDTFNDVNTYFFDKLKEKYSDIERICPLEYGTGKILSISFPKNTATDYLVMNLDIEGVSVSGGSACSSGAEKQSHVMAAIKFPLDRRPVRFSFSHSTKKEELDKVIKIIVELLKQ